MSVRCRWALSEIAKHGLNGASASMFGSIAFSVGFPTRLLAVAAMLHDTVLSDTPREKVCERCQCEADGGRVQGARFVCLRCGSAEQMVHRRLGGWPDAFTDEAKRDFFTRVAARTKPGQRQTWACVRADLKETCVRQRVTETSSSCGGPFLPKEVWMQQGWKEEVVLQGNYEYSSILGDTYQLKVRSTNTSDIDREVNEILLEKENAVTQKKPTGKKRKASEAPAQDGDAGQQAPELAEWDVPLGGPAASAGKKSGLSEEKAAAKEERSQAKADGKTRKDNEKTVLLASASLPRCTQLAKSLESVQRHKHFKDLEASTQTAIRDAAGIFSEYKEKTSHVLSVFDARQKEATAVPDLPYDKASFKASVTACQAVLKEARYNFPKPEPKHAAAKGEAALARKKGKASGPVKTG